jgi:beta-xylosidase
LVVSARGKFYAYATETAARGRGFQVMQSDDLVHWTHKGMAFTPPWSQNHLWAPEVFYYKSVFYLTYSALNPTTKKHDIGIATSKNPLGPFQHKAILVRGDQNKVGVIDTTLFMDGRTPYLLYSEEEPRGIVARQLTPDFMEVIGEPVVVLRPTLPYERGVNEAPTVIKRGGRYFLFYSAGWFESSKKDASYCVNYAVAESLLGPYIKSQRPLLRTQPGKIYGPGHQCIVTLKGGAMWMLYHGWNDEGEPRYGENPKGRILFMDRLRWENDLPVVDGPTFTPQDAPLEVKE